MKKVIQLSESDLHAIVIETVNTILNENTNEGVGKKLAMAGMLGLGVLGGANAQAQSENNKVDLEAQYDFYQRTHAKNGDTLNINDYNTQIYQPNVIMRNNITQEGLKIKKYIEQLKNPNLIKKAFGDNFKRDTIQKMGGPENCMYIYDLFLPKTMTLAEFQQKIEQAKNTVPFSLSDFNEFKD